MAKETKNPGPRSARNLAGLLLAVIAAAVFSLLASRWLINPILIDATQYLPTLVSAASPAISFMFVEMFLLNHLLNRYRSNSGALSKKNRSKIVQILAIVGIGGAVTVIVTNVVWNVVLNHVLEGEARVITYFAALVVVGFAAGLPFAMINLFVGRFR